MTDDLAPTSEAVAAETAAVETNVPKSDAEVVAPASASIDSIFPQVMAELAAHQPVSPFGKVQNVQGLILSAKGLPDLSIGQHVDIRLRDTTNRRAEVIGFRDDTTLLMPFGPTEGLGPNLKIVPRTEGLRQNISSSWLGRVVNALGEPIDDLGPIAPDGEPMLLRASPPQASRRRPVGERLDLGVKAINTFTPLCKGQRLGIFAGSGVGKSVLMAMMAQFGAADVNVIGLIGERGREVREFIEEQLGEEGLAKSVIIAATGDEPPLLRRQAAYLTTAVAEYFRNQGKEVLMLMDSVTRFAMAQREIGLSAGEPPTTRGYTPSVFAELPRLLERAGPGSGDQGNITAIFTVLVEGSDMDEPVADAVRGIVDGHIILRRRFAERGQYPAIDVLESISRMAPECNSDHENELINSARAALTTYNDMAELIRLGAYRQGSDAQVDRAIKLYDPLINFIKQAPKTAVSMHDGYSQLERILNG